MSKEDFISQYIFAALRGEWYRKWVGIDVPVRTLVGDAEIAYDSIQIVCGKTL
jgi:hypothetical protein